MRKSLIIIAAILLPPASLAQTVPGAFTLTPYGGGSFGGTFEDEDSELSVSLADSAAFGVIFDYQNSANTQYELIYSQVSTEADVSGNPSTDIDLRTLQFGGTYQFDGDTVLPFLSATLGGTNIDAASYDKDTFFSFSIGGGLQIAPSKRVGFRLEARAFGTLLRSGSSIFCVSDPAGETADCAITVAGDVLWQVQALAGVVFRF